MPTIDISLKDLENLTGKKLPKNEDQLNDTLMLAKTEVENILGDEIKINIEDSNRPDLWCVEGLARELKGALGIETGLKKYQINKSDYEVNVNKRLKNIRPFIACAVIKGSYMSDKLIKQVMQQQEKIDGTYGRNRKRTSIGLYDADLLKFPLNYTLTLPHENSFVPLQMKRELTPAQILENHPKGQEYAHLLKGLRAYPIFKDSQNKVLSMPPIINSNDLGQLTGKTKNILIEVTGTDYKAVNNVLRIMALTFADRGGKIYSVYIKYPYIRSNTTPDMSTTLWSIRPKELNQWLGTSFNDKQLKKIISKAGYWVKNSSGNTINLEAPSWRTDIMHAVDIYEDVAIMHGYNNLNPEPLDLPTSGNLSAKEKLSNKFRSLAIGYGAQEILNFTLTNKENLFNKMNLKEEKVVELENPVTNTYTCIRNWLMPGLLEFLSHNIKKEYPQRIFEVGDIVNNKLNQEKRIAFAIAKKDANYTEIKQILDSLFANLGKAIKVRDVEHPSFITGRAGQVLLNNKPRGIIGELHPQVLNHWGLENPVVAFEVTLF